MDHDSIPSCESHLLDVRCSLWYSSCLQLLIPRQIENSQEYSSSNTPKEHHSRWEDMVIKGALLPILVNRPKQDSNARCSHLTLITRYPISAKHKTQCKPPPRQTSLIFSSHACDSTLAPDPGKHVWRIAEEYHLAQPRQPVLTSKHRK